MRDGRGNLKSFEEVIIMEKASRYITKGKNELKTSWVIYAIIVASIVGLVIFFATGQDGLGLDAGKDDDFGHQSQEGLEYTYLPLEVVSVDEHGVMFYDATAEFEPNIFMAHEDLIDKGAVSSKDMFQRFEVGQQVTGEFDSEGWELFAVVE